MAGDVKLAALAAAVAMLAGSATGHHARLSASGMDNLKVKGTGFHARERVRLTVTPSTARRIVRHVRATSRGTFVVTIQGVAACAGVSGAATGNRGSHATFQFSSLVCP
jgi:hypothetical protein